MWVVISMWEEPEETFGSVHDVIGPFETEQDAMDYIPNPTPKGFKFIVQELSSGDKEFAL